MISPENFRSARLAIRSMIAPSWFDWKNSSSTALAGDLGAQRFFEVRQRGATVDLGFASAEAVEIRAVDDGDLFHGGREACYQEKAEEARRKGKNRFSVRLSHGVLQRVSW